MLFSCSRRFIPIQAKQSFAGALRFIHQQPYGSVLLAVTAVGLLAFGIYGIAEAASRRISPPPKPTSRIKMKLAYWRGRSPAQATGLE
jgi:hypothetical protein